MQLALNLVSSVSIKRKKPWPKLFWLGKGEDGVFILDGKRISQLYFPSGKTKKKIPKLYYLMKDVCALNVSQNGQFLCGALYDGKIFVWDRDKDDVKFITGLPKLFNEADKGNAKNKVFLSSCGNMILLMLGFEKLFLWQRTQENNSDDSHNILGTWSQVHCGEYPLPEQSNKEAMVDGVFYSDEVFGRCGVFSYVFNRGTELAVTTLTVKCHDGVSVSNLAHKIPNQDEEIASREVIESMRCSIKWKFLTRPLYGLTPAARLVKGRFAYVCRYSPDGQILAVVLNQKLAKNTRLMFCSTFHSTSSIVDMKCCGGSESSSGRIWWVSDISWTADSLFLIGITRNGALFLTSKLGEPMNIITSGYGMDPGPNLFLSLHPRISVRSFQENIPPETSEISTGSDRDLYHQTFSVAVHPCHPLLLCSDGYMVTIVQFSSKPDYAKLIRELTKDISRLLLKDDISSRLELTFGSLEKSAHGASETWISRIGMNTSEVQSSPGSTLSDQGFGIARHVEAGVITFGDIESKKYNFVEELTVQQKMIRSERVLLQALGIGTSCGPHWSQEMPVAMNLVIHTWVKLITSLLEGETSASEESALVHNIMTFLQTCFETFRWDLAYQHCLPWFIQFTHSTVKCIVSSKKFGFRETIEVCMKILRMAEVFLREIYAWSAVGNWATVHYLGDSFSPSSYVSVRNGAIQEPSDHAGNVYLNCKLNQSWLTLYHYVCRMYKSNEKKGNCDEKIVKILCWIQKKLQNMESSRNLISESNAENFVDQGYKMYLAGNYSEAADLLEKSFQKSSENASSTAATEMVTPRHRLQADITSTKQSPVSSFTSTLIEDDLSLKLSENIETLLSILYINLENYDLKAALALVYSFVNTLHDVNLLDLLESRLEGSLTLIAADDSEVKVTSSSSLNVFQMSLLVKYPLAWIVDNRAVPLVQHMAKFMACYFINLPLAVPAPFQSQESKCILATSSESNLPKTGTSNIKNLSQLRITEAIGCQKLERLWTVDHTMELLLVSGLIGEAAWFANCLGDWKIAFLLAVTEMFRKKNQSLIEKESHDHTTICFDIPHPETLMIEKINMMLKLNESSGETDSEGIREMFEDEHISSLENVLEASVVAELDLVPGIISQLVSLMKVSVSKLTWMVTQDLYLPAPPLYCPQPARNDGDFLSEEARQEICLRAEIAIIVQKILAVFRASRCFLYCTQSYCKYIVTQSSFNDAELPSVVKKFTTTEEVDIYEDCHSGVIRSFQEFCSLMWLLDVRNELALSSRRYNKLKQNLSSIPNDEQTQDVINQCEDVLVWLKRLLPFSDFLNATDEVLDGILTVLSELPLNSKTVDLLAQYFHTPSPSLSLTTSEKLSRITRKIRNSDEYFRLETGESLAVRYQQQCEIYRNESSKVPAQSSQNYYLELPPAFCGTLEYQHDFAFLSFLDTFLLITLAKVVTSEDYQKIPFILPYRDKPTLDAELSPFETTTRLKERNSGMSSFAIHRSQSFQDVGNVKKKVGSSELLSLDDLDSRKYTPVHRSNSLTDLRKIQPSKFSKELQEFLPKLLWLKRWCLMDGYMKISTGANKSYSFLNVSATPTAIRVQLPLKLVVNTLWLMENYYKDFSQSKGKCVRNKRARKKKRLPKKEIFPAEKGKETLVKTAKQKLNEELAFPMETKEDVDQVEGSRQKDGSEKTARVKRMRNGKIGKNERENELEIKRKEFDESSKIGHGSKLGDSVELIKTNIKVNEVKEEKELSVQHLRKLTENNVHVARFLDQKEEELSLQGVDHFCGSPSKELETSMKESPEYQFEPVLDKRSHESASSGLTGSQTDEGKISDHVFTAEDACESISNRSRFRKNISSSVDSKWKSLESVGEGLPLFSFSLLNNTRSMSCVSKISSRMVSDSCLSNASEAGMVGSFPSLYDDDASPSSESLSIGQIRSDVAAQVKVAGNVSSEASVTNGRQEKTISKQRKTARRKIQDESSSCLSSEKTRVKPIDEGSLLRKIIRSEMRKFIKAQQAEIRSQSSTSVRSVDDNVTEKLSKDEAHEPKGARRSRSRMNKKSSLELSTSYENTREKKSDKNMKQRTMSPRVGNVDLADENQKSLKSTSYQTPGSEGESLNCSPRSDQSAKSLNGTIMQHDTTQSHRNVGDTSQSPPEMSTTSRYPSKISQTSQTPVQPHMHEHGIASGHQFPSGWPVWFNPSFTVPWLYMQPNAIPPQNPASKVNNDKGIQVEDNGAGEVTNRNSNMISGSSKIHPARNLDACDDLKDAIVDAAVQTDTYFEEVESSSIDDLAREKLATKKVPFLLSLEDRDVRNNDQALSDTVVNEFLFDKEETSVTSDNGQEGISRHNDVFARGSSTGGLNGKDSSTDFRIEERESASAVDNHLSIPLLKFPTEIHDPAPQPLPFKIAWPEHAEIQSNGHVQELPLLQLSNEQSISIEPFPLPTTLPSTGLGRLENAPLLHFANENSDNIGFRFVPVPAHENTQLPLLFFPETRADPSNFFSQKRRLAGDPENGKSGEKQLRTGIANDGSFAAGRVRETSKARMKRRNQLTGNVTAEQTTMIQQRELVVKQTSSDSPSSEIHKTLQDSGKKRKPRRDKLKELNNLIRDLQRDISNDDDLVISEVSSILSPEIRYENFEATQRRKKDNNKDENTRKLPMTLENINRPNEGHIDDEKTSIPKETKASRLYQPSSISARDIHTEVPSDVQEQSYVLDAKVGTVNILRFPASVQTEKVVSPLETFNDLPPSLRKIETKKSNVLTTELQAQTKAFNVQTKELSVQTEPEFKAPVSSIVCDAAVNTVENVIDEPREENKSNVSVYPRVPVDVYLNIQNINPSGASSVPRTEERKFLSVVDIAEDDIKRHIQDKKERNDKNEDRNDQKSENIKFDEGSKMENGSCIVTSTADEIVPIDIGKCDHSTAAIFSFMDFQTSSFKGPTRRYNSTQQVQKISKEKLSRRLLDMNEQFDAIEQLTSNMEQDLLRSNRLLRTIENLNEVSDHASMPEVPKQEKDVGQVVEKATETHDLPCKRKEFSGAVVFAGDEMNDKSFALRRDFDEGKKSFLGTRPWVNKPIEELTSLAPNDHADETSVDSLEEDGITKSGHKDISDSLGRPDIASRDSISNTEDIRSSETDRKTVEGIQSPNTGLSNSNIVDREKLDNPEMLRLKLSVTPKDVLNISREKLKENLAGTTTQTVANSRSRDKSPQKQQELRKWMAKKRKVRHKEWSEKLNENRQTEFKPFQSNTTGEQTAMTSKKLQTSEKERIDNRRTQTKEQMDERLLSAYDLMNEMVTEHAPKRSALITQNSIRNTKQKGAKKTADVQTNNRYKGNNRAIKNRTFKKKSTRKTELKAPIGIRPISVSTGLSSPVDRKLEQSRDGPVYHYDIGESARQFITRKSYESYQQKLSASLDRSISFRRGEFYTLDPRVDALLDDVSMSDPLELQNLENFDSLLSGDSELRDLLCDVMAEDKPSLFGTRDDIISRNSPGISSTVGEKREYAISVDGKGKMLNTFNLGGKESSKHRDALGRSSVDHLYASETNDLEMSDEVAALLAEAKAAVGDDFSGTSEVGDIDWNEVNYVLEQDNKG